jgi:hypothetical protein
MSVTMAHDQKPIQIINELACLDASHKLVPFLGASCSKPHLKCDWQSLTIEMANFLNINPSIGSLAVAQQFVDKRGKVALCDYLRDRLLIDRFEDSLGTAHLAVLSLGIGVIYTTNQDNVFEQCAQKYKPQWRTIIQLEDLAAYRPGEPLYIKYHGDLYYPDTVVFSEKDYMSRIEDTNNFRNVRLRSDILAKSLLFIGYGFGDDTIQNIFGELRGAFGQKLPDAYLISYKSSNELKQVCKEFGVRLIDPYHEFQSRFDFDEAFERFLTLLVNTTYSKKTEADVKKLVDQKHSPQPLVTKYEMQAMENNLLTLPFEEAVSSFRNTFDLAKIPRDFQIQVVRFVEFLCAKCLNRNESDNLCDLLFFLQLDYCEGLAATSAVFSTANCRGEPSRPGNNFFPRVSHGEFDNMSLLIVAMAIQMLKDREKEIRPGFKYYAQNLISHGMPVEDYPEPAQEFIKEMFKEVWDEGQTWKIPRISFSNRPKYSDLLKSMLDKLPKSNKLPLEE